MTPTPLDAIHPYPGNPRKISAAAITGVAESIATYGWQQPIVVDKAGVVVIGHTRLLAARQLHERGAAIPNWPHGSGTAPVQIAQMSAAKIKALRIADNRTGELNSWDYSQLATEITDLTGEAFTGFDDLATAAITATGDLHGTAAPPAGGIADLLAPEIRIQFDRDRDKKFRAALQKGKTTADAIYDAVMLASAHRRRSRKPS